MTQPAPVPLTPYGSYAYPPYQPYPPYVAPPVRPRVSPPVTGWALVVAGIVAVIGSVTPWVIVSIFGSSQAVRGLDGDGAITLFGAVVVAVTGIVIGMGQGHLWTSIVAVAAAGVVVLVALLDYSNIVSRFNSLRSFPDAHVSAGYGIWLTGAGGSLALVAGITALVIRSVRPSRAR